MEIESSDSCDDHHPSKSFGGQGVKASRKPDDQSSHSSDFITKTTLKDGSLLIGEQIEDTQIEHNTRHGVELGRYGKLWSGVILMLQRNLVKNKWKLAFLCTRRQLWLFVKLWRPRRMKQIKSTHPRLQPNLRIRQNPLMNNSRC